MQILLWQCHKELVGKGHTYTALAAVDGVSLATHAPSSDLAGGCRSEMAQGSRLDYRTSRLEPPAFSGMEVDEDCGAPCSLQQQWASLDLSTGPAQALSEDLACSNCGRCTRRNKLDGSRNGEWLSCRL